MIVPPLRRRPSRRRHGRGRRRVSRDGRMGRSVSPPPPSGGRAPRAHASFPPRRAAHRASWAGVLSSLFQISELSSIIWNSLSGRSRGSTRGRNQEEQARCPRRSPRRYGIATSEVEHVLATQTLPQAKPKWMAVTVDGELPSDCSAKDIILAIISTIGTGGGVGHVIEYRGSAIRALSMEGRMTVCNMSIEGGARAGMVAPDDTTFAYVRGRPHAPKNAAWELALDRWRSLATDEGAAFDTEVTLNATSLQPYVSWGTNPAQSTTIDGSVPVPSSPEAERALTYMALEPGTPIRDIRPDTIFIGSCTNSRIEDLRAAAEVVRGRKVKDGLRALVVPGSVAVKLQAEGEGLHDVFRAAGFEWRGAGCSMCLGMNPDILGPGDRSASTSNRNFEGRQGKGGRTHLVSPRVAAATAIAGHFTRPEDL